jgi:hypothetical protein
MRARLVIVFVVVLFAGCGDEWETDRALNPKATTTAPVEGRERIGGDGLTDQQHKAAEEAKRYAKRFLKDYLPYGYGRVTVEDFGAGILTPGLRHKLREQPPRMIAGMEKARPELLALRVPGSGPPKRDRVLLFADVEDGVSLPYSLLLTLVRHPDGWAVARVEG